MATLHLGVQMKNLWSLATDDRHWCNLTMQTIVNCKTIVSEILMVIRFRSVVINLILGTKNNTIVIIFAPLW